MVEKLKSQILTNNNMNKTINEFPENVNPNADIYSLAQNQRFLQSNPKEAQRTILESLELSASLGKLDLQTILMAINVLQRINMPIEKIEIIAKMMRSRSIDQRVVEEVVKLICSTGSQANFTNALEEAYTRFPHLRST